MFWIKQTLGILLSPMAAGGIIAVVAVVLLARASTRRLGLGALVTIVAVGFSIGTTPVADRVIGPLEERYTAVHDPGAVQDSLGVPIRWIVVLGSGHGSDARTAPPGRLAGEGLYRLAEGMRIREALPQARLLLSGWGGGDVRSHAEALADAARSLGVPAEALVLSPLARDTEEEAEAVRSWISDGEPFFLVSGAVHLTRAVRWFEAEGLRPIPAPAFFYTTDSLDPGRMGLRDFLPNPANYVKVDRAVHEYLGILWARLTS